jgi:hypothetical protein
MNVVRPTRLLCRLSAPGQNPATAPIVAQKFLKEKPLIAYYDEVLMAGLKLAQADAERGALDSDRMQRIRDSVAEIKRCCEGIACRYGAAGCGSRNGQGW